jgi:hypothetical protein
MTEEQYRREHLAKLEDIKTKLTWLLALLGFIIGIILNK